MNSKLVMEKLVAAASEANNLDRKMSEAGYTGTPYWFIFGNIAEAIFAFVNEKADDFNDSVTCRVFRNDSLTDPERVRILMTAYELNR